MTQETVHAEVKDGPSIAVNYDFGDNMEEAISLFSHDVVWAYAKRALVIAVQGHARGLLKSGKSADEIQEAVSAWKPGTPRTKISPEERFKAEWAKLSTEDRANLLRELQGTPSDAPAAPQRAARRTA